MYIRNAATALTALRPLFIKTVHMSKKQTFRSATLYVFLPPPAPLVTLESILEKDSLFMPVLAAAVLLSATFQKATIQNDMSAHGTSYKIIRPAAKIICGRS